MFASQPKPIEQLLSSKIPFKTENIIVKIIQCIVKDMND